MRIDYRLIGKQIRKFRKKRGISQMALSELIDRSPTHLSYIENGVKGMSLDTFVQIANSLNVGADELLMDVLENKNMGLSHEFASIIADCSDFESRFLLDILTSAKESLRTNSRLLFRNRRL